MDPSKWIDLVASISFGTVFLMLIKQYYKTRSLLELYFSIAAIIIAIPYLLDLFQLNPQLDLFGWGKLLSITTYISGLLVLIRESKPVFARFPIYLTALPFVSVLFFPFIIDTLVIKDLLNATYQGGALIVTVLIFTLNHARKSGRRYYIIGISLVAAAYLTYWLYFNRNMNVDLVWVSEILMTTGIVITTARFVSGIDENSN